MHASLQYLALLNTTVPMRMSKDSSGDALVRTCRMITGRIGSSLSHTLADKFLLLPQTIPTYFKYISASTGTY